MVVDTGKWNAANVLKATTIHSKNGTLPTVFVHSVRLIKFLVSRYVVFVASLLKITLVPVRFFLLRHVEYRTPGASFGDVPIVFVVRLDTLISFVRSLYCCHLSSIELRSRIFTIEVIEKEIQIIYDHSRQGVDTGSSTGCDDRQLWGCFPMHRTCHPTVI